MPGRLVKMMRGLLPLVAAIVGLSAALYPSTDPDVFFHLASGREIVNTGAIPATEQFSFMSRGRPFVNHEWLYDLALFSCLEAMGPVGVTVFKAVCASALFALVVMLAWNWRGGGFLALGGLVLLVPLFRRHLDARPFVLACVFESVGILLACGMPRRAIIRGVALLCLAVLWANVHGSFLLLPLTLTVLAVMRRGSRRPLLVVAALMPLVFCLNPYGFRLYATVFHHLAPAYRRLVPEWSTYAFGDSPVRDALYLAATAGPLVAFLWRRTRSLYQPLAVFVACLVATLYAQKFLLLLACGGPPLLDAALSCGRHPRATGMGLFLLGTASALVLSPRLAPWQGMGFGFDFDEYPRHAVQFAKRAGIRGNVFNPFEYGGYLEFYAYPDLSPMIDGRAYVHGLSGVARYLAALRDYSSFRKLHERYRFDAVLVDIQSPSFPRLARGLWRDRDFAMVYLDDHFALFVPQGRLPDDAYTLVRPVTDPRYVLSMGRAELPALMREADRVRSGPSGKVLGDLLLGVAWLRLARLGNGAPEHRRRTACTRALVHLSRIVGRRPDVPMFQYFLAQAHLCLGHCGKAMVHAQKAQTTMKEARDLVVRITRTCPDGGGDR